MARFCLMIAALGLGGCHSAPTADTVLLKQLAYEKGEAIWQVSEKAPDGSENVRCFLTPHKGAVVYWPSQHRLTFTLNQGGQFKTLTVMFPSRDDHKVRFFWNQISEMMDVRVDGIPAQRREIADGNSPWQLTCPPPH